MVLLTLLTRHVYYNRLTDPRFHSETVRRKIMKRAIRITLVLLALLLVAGVANARDDCAMRGCTALIAGKNTTADGSILYAKTEDDTMDDIDYLWYVPRQRHEPGSVVRLRNGGTIPQVEETYAYLWDEPPGTDYSSAIVNEWGVAFGSNACTSKEDPVDEVRARGDLADGGLGFELRMILAERSKTAREAVLLAASLLDTYGYNASGRNLNIVGPKEAWQLQMVRGKQYVARRVRDGEVAIIANTYSIRDVDTNDRDNFICSPRLIEYAVQRGWYNPDEGAFDFAKAYAPEGSHKNPRNTDRQWNMARLLVEDFPITWQAARTGVMPVSVQPDHRLLLADVMAIMRNHYEGTDLYRPDSSTTSPHVGATICNNRSHRTAVVQERADLPLEIGTVVWRALDRPCSSVFVPWYLGVRNIPEVFHNAPESFYTTEKDMLAYHFGMPAETWSPNLDTSGGVFKLLTSLVDADYANTIGIVRGEWDAFEETAFRLQPEIERTALALYAGDKALACEFLTDYSNGLAIRSFETAKRLIGELPPSPGNYVQWGLFHYGAGDLAAAVESLDKALALDPDNSAAKRCRQWVGEEERAQANPVALSRERLDAYAGDYGTNHVTREGDRLYLRWQGGEKYLLKPISEDTFGLERYWRYRTRFVSDRTGRVEKLVVYSLEGRSDETPRDN
jgi:dipeptidase